MNRNHLLNECILTTKPKNQQILAVGQQRRYKNSPSIEPKATKTPQAVISSPTPMNQRSQMTSPMRTFMPNQRLQTLVPILHDSASSTKSKRAP